MCETGKDALRS